MSEAPAAYPRLRLLAHDADDLAVISAAVQDAVGKVGDIAYEPGPRRFTLALNRFRWEAGAHAPERVRAAVRFCGVMGVKSKGVAMGDPEAVLAVLALAFEHTGGDEDPSGVVHVRLAGGGDMRLEVECIDAVLADVSEPWAAMRAPQHRV